MSRISEKVAYLDGLMEGLDIEDPKLKKLFNAIIDALDDVAEELADHDDAIADVNDSIDEIYDDMDAYDELLYGDEDDEDEDEDDKEDEDDFFEVVCPNCGETIYFDEDMLDNPDGLICPNCNEQIEISIPEDLKEDKED